MPEKNEAARAAAQAANKELKTETGEEVKTENKADFLKNQILESFTTGDFIQFKAVLESISQEGERQELLVREADFNALIQDERPMYAIVPGIGRIIFARTIKGSIRVGYATEVTNSPESNSSQDRFRQVFGQSGEVIYDLPDSE